MVGEGRCTALGWERRPVAVTILDWQPGAVAADVADLDGDGRPELLVRSGSRITGLLWGRVDRAPGRRRGDDPPPRAGLARHPAGRARRAPLALDIDKASEKGVWRILDFDSQIITVHAALLHTGDVLFFAGRATASPCAPRIASARASGAT